MPEVIISRFIPFAYIFEALDRRIMNTMNNSSDQSDFLYENRLLNELFRPRELQNFQHLEQEEQIDNHWLYRIFGNRSVEDYIEEKREKIGTDEWNEEDYKLDLEDAFSAVRSINDYLQPQHAIGLFSPRIDFNPVIADIGLFCTHFRFNKKITSSAMFRCVLAISPFNYEPFDYVGFECCC